MSDLAPKYQPLRAGRHHLTREEVEASQRGRILSAMIEAAATMGYAEASVSEVIKRAAVSRRTFYELFHDRQSCFASAYEQATSMLVPRLSEALMMPGTRAERLTAAVVSYLDFIASEPQVARVQLIEGFAAGPVVAAHRAQFQISVAELAAEILELDDDGQRFAVHAIVHALASMVTAYFVTHDEAGVADLNEPMVDLVARLAAAYGLD